MGRDKARTVATRPPELEHSGPVFDRARRLGRTLFGNCDAQIILVGDGPAWRSHDPEGQMPPEAPAASIAVAENRLLWVGDASQDPRFCDLAAVKGPPYARFYAAAPIRLEDGSVPGVLAVAGLQPRPHDVQLAGRLQDLADFVADEWSRVNANRAREASTRERDVARRTLAAIVAAAPVSLVLTDREMRVLGGSPPWLKSRGLEGQKILGRSLFDLAPDVYERWREPLERCLGGESVSADRVAAPRPDGRMGWLRAEVAPWRDAAGEIGGLILLSHDITDMVEALERTERSEERLKLALQIADIHVWELDFVRRELVKVGAEDTFFSEPKTYQELARDLWSTVDPRDRPGVIASWERHVAEGGPHHPEYRVARSDGREVWTAGTARVIRGPDGEPLRMVGALQNITHRKAQEQALIQAKEGAESANHAKSAFLATMSHEIRTPLNGVLGMAQAMAADALCPVQRERLEVIRQSGEGLLAILNDLLDLSKIEAGKLVLEDGEFDVGDLAKGAHATFSAVADNKGLAFELEVRPAARGTYRGDALRVRQILHNLLSNALKFTEAGNVKVSVDRSRKGLTLTVADTGIGMTADQQKQLFRKFEQADASTTRRYGGTGLGLAICRDLTDLMDGHIAVASRPGEGATFTITLPLEKLGRTAKGRLEGRAAAELGDRIGALRVLAAEDNSMNQLVLRTLLAQLGVEPVMVFDGRAAVDAWEREPWDLILMDVQMPVMDGPGATAIIRRLEAEQGRARTPIVALTANAMDHQVQAYIAAGMDGFVAKPIEAGRLFAALKTALASPGGSKASAVA
ncbi:hypothetical protein DJ021_00280 [Phenylobacterium hankyongense]|uniref:Sensory/regulatory protein RpfC n=1 Tax=Phenylobacterium hankyongense TaxID=1813876 RepID=A0A328AXN9_9CAUL|nr:ATP-binding protein [Phenylobacterium hankyongense]RAK58354.1 hypothetical protein DJ021_00280 [Phenylobacterium hankyongense]